MTREELRTEAVLRAFETLIARPGLFPHAQLVAERAIEYADALVANLGPTSGKTECGTCLYCSGDPDAPGLFRDCEKWGQEVRLNQSCDEWSPRL